MRGQRRASWWKMYRHNRAAFDAISDEDAGRAIKAAFRYFDGDEIDVDDITPQSFIVFSILQANIDEANADYEEAAANGRRGAAKRWNGDPMGDDSPPIAPYRDPNRPLAPFREEEVEEDVDIEVEEDIEAEEHSDNTTATSIIDKAIVEEAAVYQADTAGIPDEREPRRDPAAEWEEKRRAAQEKLMAVIGQF